MAYLFYLIISALNNTQKHAIPQESCLEDKSFVWTEVFNVWLRNHLELKNMYIIYASYLMDMMMLSFMMFFILYWKSVRVFLAYVMFFAVRTALQVSTKS